MIFGGLMKILLIGNGAREHAIAETFKKNKNAEIYSYMKSKNPGISSLSSKIEIGAYSDLDKIKKFAQANNANFAFIGPEDPLNEGVVDALQDIGIDAIGPTKLMARLETSKSFTRDLLKKYKIEGNPKFMVFDEINFDEIKNFIDGLDNVVVKPDGLTGGKGVKVQGDHFGTKKEAVEYCKEVLETHPAVIVEEKLDGEEFSLQCLTDGKTVIATPPVQDHKRAYDDDKGENTFKKFIPLLPKILKLRDVINRDFKDAYKDVGRRFAWLEGTRDESVDTLEFLKEDVNYRLPVAYIYPLLAAFRSCVQCDKNKCIWMIDPIKFWDDIKESLVSRLAEQAMAHKNPDKFGKDPVVWGRCYDTALLEILKRKAGDK